MPGRPQAPRGGAVRVRYLLGVVLVLFRPLRFRLDALPFDSLAGLLVFLTDIRPLRLGRLVGLLRQVLVRVGTVGSIVSWVAFAPRPVGLLSCYRWRRRNARLRESRCPDRDLAPDALDRVDTCDILSESPISKASTGPPTSTTTHHRQRSPRPATVARLSRLPSVAVRVIRGAPLGRATHSLRSSVASLPAVLASSCFP